MHHTPPALRTLAASLFPGPDRHGVDGRRRPQTGDDVAVSHHHGNGGGQVASPLQDGGGGCDVVGVWEGGGCCPFGSLERGKGQ